MKKDPSDTETSCIYQVLSNNICRSCIYQVLSNNICRSCIYQVVSNNICRSCIYQVVSNNIFRYEKMKQKINQVFKWTWRNVFFLIFWKYMQRFFPFANTSTLRRYGKPFFISPIQPAQHPRLLFPPLFRTVPESFLRLYKCHVSNCLYNVAKPLWKQRWCSTKKLLQAAKKLASDNGWQWSVAI